MERSVRREGLRLFGIRYYDLALAPHVREGTRLRVAYDPRDLSAVHAAMPDGTYLRVPYADLGRPLISLAEHREAARRLRAEGRSLVDEGAIFAAVAERRRTVTTARTRRDAARRATAREERADPSAPRAAAPALDAEGARVPIPTAEDIAASEFWT